jgi:predicted RNA-binding Zn ribbon-like protein
MAIAKDFGFIGRLCLDFAHTGDMGYESQFERLTSRSELQRWLSLSSLHLSHVRIKSADLRSAKKLRRAIWKIAVALATHATPSTADIRVLNRAACLPGLVRKLNPAAKSMRWDRPTMRGALATIAQDAVTLFGDPTQKKRVRRCENPRCIVIFYDDSRPGLRRWCAANRCGDRIRARVYRKRQQARNRRGKRRDRS